ncbi:outer membrane protein assembly factor BamB family protein [Agromyces cerinus]|uniref:PQQ-like domain-containing protein n=1 Tax=Agromyces cerinus subsp. cerinus TaxID=232089 RepID=A0A1N6I208_9MICO|nr:PQQ-binding-like beta-propeller repeat protein [Agromyces cerinus]SIO26051.1 PQQ-like domain-containing protein [Agromyces cerinus subsp. cerinus]
MNHNPTLTRRVALQAGGAGGLAVIAALMSSAPAHAAGATPTAQSLEPIITDLGPAVVQFSLMSSVTIGDTVYIGSRNVEPARIVALHLPTGRVIGMTEIGTGHSLQAMAADPTGRYVYAGVLQKAGGPQPNLYRWDVTTLGTPAEAIGRIGDRDVRAVAVSPDGRLYAVGSGAGTPALWEYDPVTGQVANLGTPDPAATGARAVAATETTVFFGGGTLFGGGAARAGLFAYDRAGGASRDITPAEMLNDPSIRELAVIGGKLVVGSAASTAQSKVAVMDLDDLTSYSIATSIGKTAKKFAMIGDTVYFANEGTILSYSPASGVVAPVEFDGPAVAEVWGLDSGGGTLVATSSYGFVLQIDPVAGTSVVTDLAAAGAPAAAQAAMGVAAGLGSVFVGGSGTVAHHRLAGGPVEYLRAPGEAKDAIVVGGVLLTGQYSSEGIWRYDPRDGRPITKVAEFPGEQNRPHDVCWDDVHGLALVGVQSDTVGGGSLWTYDPQTEQSKLFTNPIDATQYVRAVVSREGVAYLGGGLQNADGPGTVVAFDPVTGEELWRTAPLPGSGIAALAVRGRHLYGLTRRGGFFVIDLTRRTVVHTADHSSLSSGYAAMVTNRGVVYAVSDTDLFRFDPTTFAATVVVPDINGSWYSGSHITNDEQGRLYTMRGRNLVQIDDRPRS